MKEGVYTLPVLHALRPRRGPRSWRTCSARAPDGERLDRALEIVRSGGVIERRAPRRGGRGQRTRPTWPDAFPRGRRSIALIQLARFLAARCGAEQAHEPLLLESAPGWLAKALTSVDTYYPSYGVVLAVDRGGGFARRGGVRDRSAWHRTTPPVEQAHHLRMRDRPGGRGLVAEPGPLLHLRIPVRDLRRRERLPVPLGAGVREPRVHGGRRDGHLHRRSWPWACSTPGARGC